MDLQTTQQTMHQLLRGSLSIEDAAHLLNAPAERLAAYARFTENHIEETLNKVFQKLRNELPSNLWEILTHTYYREYPATHYELNACVESFIDFLETRSEITPTHVESAQIEWYEWLVYSDPTEITPNQGVNPTLKILQQTPEKEGSELEARGPEDLAVAQAEAMVRGAEQRRANHLPKTEIEIEIETKLKVQLIWRDLQHHVHSMQATDALLFAIKVTFESIPLMKAAIDARIPIETAQQFIHDAHNLGILV